MRFRNGWKRVTTTKRLSLIGALSLMVACSGSIPWESVCGCTPAPVGLAEDLGVDSNTEFTPEVLTAIVGKRLSNPSTAFDLKAVRSLGYAFDQSCHRTSNRHIRCTFWLWAHDRMGRGIELNLREHGPKQELRLSAHYVYEALER